MASANLAHFFLSRCRSSSVSLIRSRCSIPRFCRALDIRCYDSSSSHSCWWYLSKNKVMIHILNNLTTGRWPGNLDNLEFDWHTIDPWQVLPELRSFKSCQTPYMDNFLLDNVPQIFGKTDLRSVSTWQIGISSWNQFVKLLYNCWPEIRRI